MIVDSVEAAARSLHSQNKLQTKVDKQSIIDKIISGLEMDRQLDDMKVGQLRLIKLQLFRELDGMYHQRISYNDDEIQGDKVKK